MEENKSITQKVKVKLKTLIDSEPRLIEAGEEKLIDEISYSFSKTIREVKKELEFYEIQKNKRVEEFGEIDPNKPYEGKSVRPENAENWQRFLGSMTDILAIEVEIETRLFTHKELASKDEHYIKPNILAELHWLLIEPA